MFGIRTSISTRSGLVRATSASASCPSRGLGHDLDAGKRAEVPLQQAAESGRVVDEQNAPFVTMCSMPAPGCAGGTIGVFTGRTGGTIP